MLAVIDARAPTAILSALKALGHTVCPLPPDPSLAKPVSGHADLLFFFAKNVIFCTPRYYALAQEEIERIATFTGLPVRTVSQNTLPDYPGDVLLNAAVLGECLIAHPRYVAPEILALSYRELIPVRQGYAKCSVLPVSDEALITEDPSIAKAAAKAGIEVLQVSQNAVALPGYNTGFLGGAASFSPYRPQKEILFCGNLDTHPDVGAIRGFCARHGVSVHSLTRAPLFDVGTLFLLERNQ